MSTAPREGDGQDGRKDACQTYVEQTKLLVTLASTFLVAPAALLAIAKGGTGVSLTDEQWHLFVISELLFVASVIAGYVVLATVAGSQHNNSYNVYRPATRISSVIQLLFYAFGLGGFVWLVLASI